MEPTTRPRRAARAFTAVLPLALAAQACAPNEVSISIIQNQALAGGAGGGCVATPDPGSLFHNSGTLDLSLRTNYYIYPLFRSELQSNVAPTAGRAETRGFFVEGVDVELRPYDTNGPALTLTDAAGAVPTTYRVISTTFVPPSMNGAPGYGVGEIELIPERVGRALQGQYCRATQVVSGCPVNWQGTTTNVVARIRPFGHTMGGVYLDGATFTFPLRLCCHCLVTFGSVTFDPITRLPSCSGSATSGGLCNVGQDTTVDCSECAGNAAACQPVGFQNSSQSCPAF